jgi:hypothetical protein
MAKEKLLFQKAKCNTAWLVKENPNEKLLFQKAKCNTAWLVKENPNENPTQMVPTRC